jgi:hypothetical protein
MLVALILPVTLIPGMSTKRHFRRGGAALVAFGFALGLVLLPCGGGGKSGEESGGGGGSKNYSITVSATETGSSTTRTMGIVNVTVMQ